ncbi:unnamed protein product [Fusarium graminearum]|nr:unnamed protein product [Fusarium graminearum]VTO87707.1 unnamed protein product [Fusarium graminearum]
MAEERCSDYRLSAASLQSYLRKTFNDDTIAVESINGHYVFNLSQGCTLTEAHKNEINALRVQPNMSIHNYPIFDMTKSGQRSLPKDTAEAELSERAYMALRASCDRQSNYPCNLMQRKQLKSTTELYRRQLNDEGDKIFNHDFEEIHFHELQDKGTDYGTSVIRNTPSVQKHLHQDGRDPISRFVFIQAEHSRAPLNCSRDSFSHILSYHQVPPTFIDFVSAFGFTHYPTDYHMTGFDSDDTLAVKDPSKLLTIPTIGRSGREHRMQYLLRSAERDYASDGSRKWNIRQTAVYHTFDLIEGKALWINMKANSLLEDRIKEATADSAIMNSTAMGDLAESFSSTLTIHLIFLEWCDQDWRTCINDCESKIRNILAKAQTSRVDQPAEFNASAKRALVINQAKTTGLSNYEKRSFSCPSIWKWKKRIFPKSPSGHDYRDFNEKERFRSVGEVGHTQRTQINNLNNLDTFSFDSIQQLHYLEEQLGSYHLVMELNRQAMHDIAERYRNLISHRGCPEYLQIHCLADVEAFIQRVERIKKNLDIRMAQVTSLLAWLRDGKDLLDRILQYRNVQIGRIFTESSFGQSEKMERIAYKTEKETISMHVITCVTLAFLPAMFVATFFQSGLWTVATTETDTGPRIHVISRAVERFLSLESAEVVAAHASRDRTDWWIRNQARYLYNGPCQGECLVSMTTQFEISFRQWIPSVSKVGVDGSGDNRSYVPATELETYWSEDKLPEIISAITPVMSVPLETIKAQYLRVFSTLVSLGRPEAIRHFLALGMSDGRLPLRLNELPVEWNHEFDGFIDKQWPFYKEYCEFAQQEVVFKIYKEPRNTPLYKREADAYTRLRAFTETAITECYGSLGYPGTNRWIIILEHAEIGSLLDFFANCETPVRSDDYKMLWERLSNLFNGLYLLHNPSQTNVESLTGIHQDIQPANILVFRRTGNSIYDVVFKLADFGLTELVKKDEWREGATVPTNTEGNRMLTSEARPRLSSLTDLWSIGAVFSEFLVWSIGGNGLREEYRKRRKDAIAKLPNVQDRGSCACFHDTLKRLPAVDSFHGEILKLRRAGDVFSPHMSDFILSFLMVEPNVRLLAGQANGRAKKMIEDAQQSPKPQRPGTPEDIHPANSPKQAQMRRIYGQSTNHFSQRGYTFSIGETKVTVQDVYNEIKNKTNWRLKRDKSSQAGMKLSGMQRARNKVNALSGREQIFVIDDSDSMEPYKTDVAMTARVISYTVKVSDQNGMDLYFTSDSVKHQSSGNSSYFEDSIKNKWTVKGSCDMKKCLEDVMEGVVRSGMKPTSIYIFTDGVWDLDHDPEVDKVIHGSIERLVNNGKEPKDLMFQFIQFGDNDIGYSRLKYLDDGCKMMVNGMEYDIVDTKHWQEHVPRIIIGSLDRYNDID